MKSRGGSGDNADKSVIASFFRLHAGIPGKNFLKLCFCEKIREIPAIECGKMRIRT
jgi:hypothetical protein